jgi:hypothetical protein
MSFLCALRSYPETSLNAKSRCFCFPLNLDKVTFVLKTCNFYLHFFFKKKKKKYMQELYTLNPRINFNKPN